VRRPADELDPPDLHRRIGQRRVRRREPAVLSDRATRLLELLGLSEDELCLILDADALTLLSGQLEQASELRILLALLDEAAEQAGPGVLRRWVRAAGPAGRPIESLLARDFGGFEDALAELSARGFVLRGGASGRD
jgi:hypothetical protein